MILGISVAMPDELSMLTRERLAVGVCRELHPDVLVMLAGIGAQRARQAGMELIDRGATALLSWGAAAALAPALTPGSLMLPHCIIGADQAVYPASSDWHERLRRSLAPHFEIHTAPLAESLDVVSTPAEKQQLRLKTEADATDMESGALAQLAREREVPFCAVRAIVDPANMGLPQSIMQAVDPDGQMRTFKFMMQALAHPGDWKKLMQLSRNYKSALRTLARVIELTGPQVLAF